DETLGEVTPPDAIGQHSDDKAEAGAGRRHDQQPQEMVEDRLPEDGIGERPVVVGQADKDRARAVVEGQDERRDDRVDQIDAEKEESWSQEEPWTNHRPPVQISGGQLDVVTGSGKEDLEDLVR